MIGILESISIIAYTGVQNSAAETALKSDLRNAATQLSIDHVENGVYPESDAALTRSAGTTFEYDSDGATYCLSAASQRAGVPVWHISHASGLTEVRVQDIPLHWAGATTDPVPRGRCKTILRLPRTLP